MSGSGHVDSGIMTCASYVSKPCASVHFAIQKSVVPMKYTHHHIITLVTALSLILILLLLAVAGKGVAWRASVGFPDVVDGQWYTKFVITAANKGIIKGYPDGTFRPADQVKTAEFLKMLSLTFGLELKMDFGYSDVPADSWFAPYAGIAQKYNLFPDRSSLLSPEKPLSRGDVAVAIYQYLANR